MGFLRQDEERMAVLLHGQRHNVGGLLGRKAWHSSSFGSASVSAAFDSCDNGDDSRTTGVYKEARDEEAHHYRSGALAGQDAVPITVLDDVELLLNVKFLLDVLLKRRIEEK